jgi:hypothetical protein
MTTHQEAPAMKYVLLIHQGSTPTPQTPEAWDALSAEQQRAIYKAYRDLTATPGVTPGAGLQHPDTATTVRVQDGRVLTTDGPFVEAKEAVGGFFMLEADDLDTAIEVAAKVPAASLGGAVEVRPVQEQW